MATERLPALRAIHEGHSTFVRGHTRIASVPLIPTIRLHQAEDALLLWETTERDLAAHGLMLPFWAVPWAGGIALARHLLDHPRLVAGRRVLDIGSGSGLVAIAAAQAGAAHVTANDIDPLALTAAEMNAAVNGVEVTPLQDDLLDEHDHLLFESTDVVLAADLAYERSMSERAFALLFRLAVRGTDVYVGDPGRAYLPTAGLRHLDAYEVPVAEALEGINVKLATVWRIAARRTQG